jgi:PEP-CTERM motif
MATTGNARNVLALRRRPEARSWRRAKTAVGVAALIFAHLCSAAKAGPDFTLTRSSFDGEPLAQWTQNWWTWALQAPFATNPLLDTTGAYAGVDNNGPVFFIAGTSGGSADRTFDVPAGKPLLIPMLNQFDTLDPKSTENKLLQNFQNSVTSLFATIDGTSIKNPQSFLVRTDFFSMGETQLGSFIAELGAPVGVELYPTKSSGYWLMVSGLSLGEHTLTFGGSLSNGFSTSVTDRIDIVPGVGTTFGDYFGIKAVAAIPEPSTWAMLLAGFAVLGVMANRAARKSAALAA